MDVVEEGLEKGMVVVAFLNSNQQSVKVESELFKRVIMWEGDERMRDRGCGIEDG